MDKKGNRRKIYVQLILVVMMLVTTFFSSGGALIAEDANTSSVSATPTSEGESLNTPETETSTEINETNETEISDVVIEDVFSDTLVQEPHLTDTVQRALIAPEAIVANGTFGTAEWTLDDAGVLTFGGGVFPYEQDEYREANKLNDVDKTTITKVVFTGPVTAGIYLSNLFAMKNLTEIVDLQFLDTSNTRYFYSMFEGAENLASVDVSTFNTSNAQSFDSMFQNCSKLTTVDVGNWNTAKVTSIYEMFQGATSLTSLDVSNWNVSQVKFMLGVFNSCENLEVLDVSNWDTSQVQTMGYAFQDCAKLKTIDVSNWDMSSVTRAHFMFKGCTNLTGLDVSNWNTEWLSDYQSMFEGCKSLKKLDLTNWTTRAPNGNRMLAGAYIEEFTVGPRYNFVGYSFGIEFLNYPPRNTEYSGNWKNAETGEVYNQNELITILKQGGNSATYVWEEAFFMMNFDLNGVQGVAPESQRLDFEEKVVKPADPTHEEYTFVKWTTDQKGTTEWNFDVDTMPGRNVTLYAQWQKPYTVEYYQEQLDGTFEVFESVDIPALTGTTVTATVKEYTGFYYDTRNTNKVLEGAHDADGNLVLKVYYRRNWYQVSFQDYDYTYLRGYYGMYGTPIELPEPPHREGYVFSHWNLEMSWVEMFRQKILPKTLQPTSIPAYNAIYFATYIEEAKPPVLPEIVQPQVKPQIDTGRTCQDDGYPSGAYWDGTACIVPGGYVVPNTGIK